MKIIKMLEYSQYLRHAYFDTFTRLSWDEFLKDRGASFGSIRNIFLHCVEVLDRYVNQYIRGNSECPRINFDDYDSIDKIKIYLYRVESDVNGYLKTITPEELTRKFERKFTSGTVTITVEDALIDIFQEETHHYGEFIALLWQIKIEPPHLGWSKYLNIKP
jgi:uncharacterized damage-inducible protein DinB